MPKRLNIAALAIACIALFVALGGTSYAAKVLIGPKQLKQNAVTTKKIKNGHVRTADIKNGGIQMTDLSGPLQAQVQSNFELLDNAVTSAKVAPNTLTADDLGTNSVDSDEIAGSAVTDAELASNAVDSNEIENGSLNAPDVGQYSGSVSRNFASIDAGECASKDIDPTPAAQNISGHAAFVTPGIGFGGLFTFHTEVETSTLTIKVCNPTASDADPDGAGGTIYNYIVFG